MLFGHRHDVGDRGDVAIHRIDALEGDDLLPQPADAALLIFLEQQAGAFALAAEVGVGLELVNRPAGDREHAENGDPEREQDREDVLERKRVTAEDDRNADARGEGRHPRGDAGRDDDQAERADSEAGHQRRGDDLAAGRKRREHVERKAEPQASARDDVDDHRPLRHLAARAADMGDRLGSGDLHRDEIDAGNGRAPRNQPGHRDLGGQSGDHHDRSDDIGGGEEGRELGARNQLDVPQRRAFALVFAIRQAERLPVGKPRSNHTLVAIWGFVHPLPVSTSADSISQRAFKPS